MATRISMAVFGSAEAFADVWAPLASRLGVELTLSEAPEPVGRGRSIAAILS